MIYGVRRILDGAWWCGSDRGGADVWSVNPNRAREFEHHDDAKDAALVECEAPPAEWSIDPLEVNA